MNSPSAVFHQSPSLSSPLTFAGIVCAQLHALVRLRDSDLVISESQAAVTHRLFLWPSRVFLETILAEPLSVRVRCFWLAECRTLLSDADGNGVVDAGDVLRVTVNPPTRPCTLAACGLVFLIAGQAVRHVRLCGVACA